MMIKHIRESNVVLDEKVIKSWKGLLSSQKSCETKEE
jgi:hypothetical protein